MRLIFSRKCRTKLQNSDLVAFSSTLSQSFENVSNKSATNKNGTGRPYIMNGKKYCNGFTVYLIRTRRLNGDYLL